MKKTFWRWIGVVFVLTILLALIPTVSAAEDSRIEAHRAYYDYLNEEIEGIGSEIREEDFYKTSFYLTNMNKAIRPATVEGLLAAYLVDLTGDGVEELFLKRIVEYKYKDVTFVYTYKAEWICVYSYIDGKIERIGQTMSFLRNNGDNTYTSYDPDGYIGTVLSLSSIPSYPSEFLTLCYGTDGKAYLREGEIATALEGSFTVYSFNGTHMAEDTRFEVTFIPDWSIGGGIHSDTGSHSRRLNGEKVTDSEYAKKVKECTGGGSYKLVNNDYRDVLDILSQTIAGKDVPYGDANPHYHAPSDWIVENNQHYQTCQSGCDVKLNLGECSGGDKATCVQKSICSVCENPYGEFAEHNQSTKYSSENGKHFFTCKTKGCTAVFDEGDCVDSDKDHDCDVCDGTVGVHEAVAGTHNCDYCGLRATSCEDYDSNKDHICDLCGGEVRVHAAYSDEHICRYCGGAVSECLDNNRDGKCDICKEAFESESAGGSGIVIALVVVAVIALSGVLVLILIKKRKKK